jgi:hypothetical protein
MIYLIFQQVEKVMTESFDLDKVMNFAKEILKSFKYIRDIFKQLISLLESDFDEKEVYDFMFVEIRKSNDRVEKYVNFMLNYPDPRSLNVIEIEQKRYRSSTFESIKFINKIENDEFDSLIDDLKYNSEKTYRVDIRFDFINADIMLSPHIVFVKNIFLNAIMFELRLFFQLS